MLKLVGFAKQYLYGARLFGGVSAEFASGETVAVFGGEGSGKSSFLKALGGAEAHEGEVLLDGEPLRLGADGVVMVFEDGAVFPFRTVYDNLAYPLRLRGVGKVEIASRVIAAAERMSIGACLNLRARNLNAEDRRRMSLARLLVRDVRLALVDEPTKGLMRESAESVMRDFCEAVRELRSKGATVLYSTSHRDEMFAACDRVVVLAHGEVKQIASPAEILRAPESVWAAQAVDEDYNVRKCTLTDKNGRLSLVYDDGTEQDAECLRHRAAESYIGKEVLAGWYPDCADGRSPTGACVLAVGSRRGFTLISEDGIKELSPVRRGEVRLLPSVDCVTLYDNTNECSIMIPDGEERA